MEVYFLKSVACLAIFLLFYKLLLEKENMHVFKRFYLLTAMLAAVAIPFITFTTYVEPSPEVFQPLPRTALESTVEASAGISDYLQTGLWITYILGVLFFSIKFCRNFLLIIQRIRKNPKVKDQNFITVLLSEKLNPHTFFNYIFLNKIKYEKQEIPKEVIIHEQAHAVQKHSLDILLIELAQIIFWYNPLLFLLKDTIKLNHEFLADESVLKKGTNPTGYKKTLLSYSSGGLESGLVNPINYSSIKKRFTVMKTQTSKTAVWARSFLVLPLLAVLVYGFSTKEVVEKQLKSSTYDKGGTDTLKLSVDDEGTIFLNNIEMNVTEIKELDLEKFTNLSIDASPNVPKAILDELVQIGVNSVAIKEVKVRSNGNQSLDIENFTPGISIADSQQEKATPEMVAEYNKLAKQFNSSPKGNKVFQIEDYNKMANIYRLMSLEQKEAAEPFPKIEVIEVIEDKIEVKEVVEEEMEKLEVVEEQIELLEVVEKQKATPEMILEYNKLARNYNEKEITEKVVQEKAFQRMLYIFGLMTESQRKKAEKLPPPPPPAPVEEGLPAPPPPPLVEDLPKPPPPPPPVTFEELVKDGATFFYNGKIIKPEEARQLVEVEKKVKVHITSTNDEKPVVRLTVKKDKK